MKIRLDRALVKQKLVMTRSQAESYIKLGRVTVGGRVLSKTGELVSESDDIKIAGEQYVSRAAFKLASVVNKFKLNFKDKTILDVGSSTGGFTDYALKHGAKKVIAVDIGTNQLHPSLRSSDKVELHEKTDIRNFVTESAVDIVLIDVSFISLTKILGYVTKMSTKDTQIVAMVKPQFESSDQLKHKGVVKNDTLRRKILKDFEFWVKDQFVVIDKADSDVSGEKGNLERFYLLRKIKR